MRIACFGGAVGGGHRIEAAPAGPLSSTPSEVRKNGRMVSPDTVGELVDESREIDGRHVPACAVRGLCTYRRLHGGQPAAALAVLPAGACAREPAELANVRRPGP